MIILKSLRVEDFKLLRRVELVFPRQGSVLIEGLNESGKSTIFESVFYALYGVLLVTEGRGKGNLESVIRHGEESASVELVLEVGATELEIRRVLKRGRPSQASLVVWRGGAPEERVAGVQPVNARIVEELGGLDGEAMLNSCFVEQKKLSKLEDLVGGQRRDSLRKLLNLERMTALAERFRVTVQDERALAQARDRLELAEVAERLPTLIAERAALEACLGAATLSHLGAAEREDRIARARRDLDEGPARGGWSGATLRLEALRGSAAAARRRSLALASAGAAGLLVSAGLLATGSEAGLWSLPVIALLGLLAVLALRPVRQIGREVAELETGLAVRRDALVEKAGEMEGRRRLAEERLGLEGATVDLAECRPLVERLARQREVRRRAAALLEGTMERIVRLVLPNTERNLGQILPLLTVGRYHEARIAEDYQIQVWDDSAGRYVSKTLFSGGAKDQFSLALRLAFALATLPQELGATPGFLFLDEPLSSFDVPRTEALVQLLTTGQVASSFSQIFVISHSRSFDVGAFRYRLVMRDGRVVEGNL